MISILGAAARHGRLVLVFGLAVGMALPQLALAMKPWIGEMVAGLLFLAALRVGPRQAVGASRDLGAAVGLAALFQLAFPLTAIALFALLGWQGALATGLVLMLAAAPVSASPNLAILTGNDPAAALRQVVIGTALLPLTVIPVFWLTPAFGDPSAVPGAAARLMILIGAAAGLGFVARATLLREPSAETLRSIDGASAIALAVVVVGLMSAVGPALIHTPELFAATVATACAVNFALQVAVASAWRRVGRTDDAAAIGIVAGNRNIALFLAVLPADAVDPLLLFIGCYQIPMYLTPAVLGSFYRLRRSTSE